MSDRKIMTVLENYKTLKRDIKKIEGQTRFLKAKEKELEEILINYLNKNRKDTLSNVTLKSNIRRGPLSKKYLENILLKYYRNSFLNSQSKSNNSEVIKYSNRKTKALLDYILKNRSSEKYYRLKIN